MTLRRALAVPALLIALALGLGACAGSPGPAAAAPLLADAVVVDVRTPGEFAEGHLDGAVNIDVQATDFAARAAELPVDAPVVVYCRSGNRSAAAVAVLRDLGFTDLTDAGAMPDAAASLGLDIVR